MDNYIMSTGLLGCTECDIRHFLLFLVGCDLQYPLTGAVLNVGALWWTVFLQVLSVTHISLCNMVISYK